MLSKFFYNDSDAMDDPFYNRLNEIRNNYTNKGLYNEARHELNKMLIQLESLGGDLITAGEIRNVKFAIQSIDIIEYRIEKNKVRKAAIILLGLKRRGNIHVPKYIKYIKMIGIHPRQYTKVQTLERIDKNFMIWFAQVIFYCVKNPQELKNEFFV